MGLPVPLTRCGIVVACLLLGAPSPHRTPRLDVTETLLGPFSSAGRYAVSPDGGHYAVFSTHGSREVIVVDGVDGPEFDDAGRPNPGTGAIGVAFSPDGKRSAYIARKGDKWVAVVDGKEAFTVASVKPEPTVPGIDLTYIHGTDQGRQLPQQFLFSQSGAHVAVVGSEDRLMYMFLDGVKGPGYTIIDVKQVAFVGDKLVYAAATADQKWHMVVNTTPGPAYDRVSSLMVSENNLHYAFIGQNGQTGVVVAGGATAAPPTTFPGTAAHDLVIASNGRVGFLGASGVGPHGPTQQPLFVGAQEVVPDAASFLGMSRITGSQTAPHIVFSPDGSKFAYAKRVPGGVAAVIEGKTSIAYDGIGLMDWSPDGKRAYFVGQKAGINFVVIDGKEMDGQDRVKNFRWSLDGTRFGYEAPASVVMDGKESPKFRELIDNSLTISADGKHYAFAACTQYSQCQVIQDGTATNTPRVEDFTTRTGPPRIPFPGVFFSPDGSRLGYNTNVHTVVVDGKEIGRGAMLEFPSWSPDGKHFAVMAWTGRGMTPIVDGAVGPAYDDILEANRNVVRFIDASTFRFLAVKGGSVYRVLMTVK